MTELERLRRGGLVLATGNRGKALEFQRILEPLGIQVSTLKDHGVSGEPEESAPDFEGNAEIKARFAFEAIQRPVLADDSGLSVDALGGEPGVKSARYGGAGLDDAGRRRYLLGRMSGLAEQQREARFVCVLALIIDSETLHLFRGEAKGIILTSERGSGGFGYDPLFLDTVSGKTFAEMDGEEKDRVSHRGRALGMLLDHLKRRP
jgi:XTP/dITP diphosphohydrolase